MSFRRHSLQSQAPPETLREMEKCARALAKSVQYVGAATVEFLYDLESCMYFFLELNPRLQASFPGCIDCTDCDTFSHRTAWTMTLRHPHGMLYHCHLLTSQRSLMSPALSVSLPAGCSQGILDQQSKFICQKLRYLAGRTPCHRMDLECQHSRLPAADWHGRASQPHSRHPPAVWERPQWQWTHQL